MIKNVKRVELNTKAAAAFLERGAFLIYTKFTNHDINKFILLLPKGVYPYKYMDDC